MAVADDPGEVADAVAILAGLPIEGAVADREGLYFSARLFVEAVARERPTMLVFEDIHFADPSLLDLVEFLASRVQDVPLLMVATSRPELLATRPSWGGGLLASSAISLGPLDDEDAVELTGRLFEQRGLGELKDRAASLAGSSDGNPLFIEELTASLAERSTRDASQLPGSIRGIVAARLDALPRARARRRARRVGGRQGVLARGARATAPGTRSGSRRAPRGRSSGATSSGARARHGSRAISSSRSSTG